MTIELTLISRYGCHLCEDMEKLLPGLLEAITLKAPGDTPIHLRTLYVNDDPDLEKEFGSLVPILKGPDKEICHYFLDAKALQQYISEAGNQIK